MIYHKEVTASTNLDARAGKPFDVFTADFQTAGRGRLDHAWQSAAKQNLMFSIVLPAGDTTLPLIIGLALIKELTSILQLRLQTTTLSLKWPNDIVCLYSETQKPRNPETQKLAGILCERVGDNVIAGIGVNVNQTAFPPEIADRATSLALLLGSNSNSKLQLGPLLDRLVASIVAHHARWAANGFAALWPEFAPYDVLRGRTVSVLTTDADPAPISGLCGGIQPDGSLLVGTTPVYSGEAHVCSL